MEDDREFEILDGGEWLEVLEVEKKELLDVVIIQGFEVGLRKGQQLS